MTINDNQIQEWPLKKILRIEVGDRKATKDIVVPNGDIPYIQSGHLKNTKDILIKLRTTREMLKAKAIDSSQKVLTRERLLLAMARLGTAGRVGIYREEAIHNDATAALIPIVPIDIHYLFHYFRYKQSLITHEVEQQGKPRITKAYLEKILIPLPYDGIEKQKNIVKQIEDRLVEIEKSYKLIEDTQHEITNLFDKTLSDIFNRQIEQISKGSIYMQTTIQNMREIANDSRSKLAQVERAIYQRAFTGGL